MKPLSLYIYRPEVSLRKSHYVMRLVISLKTEASSVLSVCVVHR